MNFEILKPTSNFSIQGEIKQTFSTPTDKSRVRHKEMSSLPLIWIGKCIYITGAQGFKPPGSMGPKQTRMSHWWLIKSTGRETSHGKIRKGLISVKPIPGRQWTNISNTVSKVLKILLVYIRKMCKKVCGYWQVGSKGQADNFLRVNHTGSCWHQGSCYCMRG